MRVYIIRHGESENNFKKLWTGWLNIHLTEKGTKDAEKAREFLKDVKFDKVFSSDLQRAIETTEIALPNYEYETSSLLREINVGNIAGKPVSILTLEERKDAVINGYAAYGGETKAEITERVIKFKKELENMSFERVALVSHAGWLRGFFDEVVGTILPRTNIMCLNCAIGIFEYEKGIWKLHSWINLD